MPLDGDNVFCIMTGSIVCSLPATVYSDNNINMTVPPIYVPMVTVTAYPGTRLAPGETDTLVASVIFGGQSYSYQWAVNGAPVTGAITDTFISSSLTDGATVSCAVTGVSFCGTATRSGEVVIVDTLVPSTGIQQVWGGLTNIMLVPNPNNGTFTILGTLQQGADESITMEITDMLGRAVYEKMIAAQNGTINEQVQLGNTVPPGMYIMNLRSGDVNKVIHFVVGQ
jgi:hypothetical protein